MFDGSISNISVLNTEFSYSYAGQSGGGAVTITGGNIIFDECTFNANCAHQNSIGGAILMQVIDGVVDDNTNTYVFNSLFVDNFASSGGAIAVQTLGVNELSVINYNEIISYLLNIENVTLENNKALMHCGGGVYLNYGTINFFNNKIINNKAFKCGGGLYVENGGINIIKDIYDNNIAGDYGGGLVTNSMYAEITNVNINNNSADNYGGGIYVQECPENIWENIQFDNNNKAIFGGNDIFMSDQCNALYANMFENNISLWTVPVSFNISWDIPHEFSHSDTLTIIINLYDSFGQKVIRLSPYDRFIVCLEYTYL